MNSSKEKRVNYKTLILWSALGVLTIIFSIIMGIELYARTLRPNAIVEADLYTLEETEYYVYVYGSEDHENHESISLEEHVINYYQFIKKHSKNDKSKNIFVFDIDLPENQKFVNDDKPEKVRNTDKTDDLNFISDRVPTLLIIKGNKVSRQEVEMNEIKDFFASKISEIKKLK